MLAWYKGLLTGMLGQATQSTLKLSPLELLYGRAVHGLLQVLRELWVDDVPNPDVSITYEYVISLANLLK